MIRDIKVYPNFISLGRETVSVKIITDKGSYSASVPLGTSKGSYEAVEFPTKKTLEVFSQIRHEFIRRDETDWKSICELLMRLDGTKNFSKIGIGLALGISMAAARASTDDHLWKLSNPDIRRGTFPYTLGNTIGGGKHGGGTDWQEFLLLNHRAKDPEDGVKKLIETWSAVGEELQNKKVLVGRNLENAWMSTMNDFQTLDFISEIAEDWNMKLGMDFAASSFWNGKKYVYKKSGKELTKSEQIDIIEEVAKKYNIYYLEDPFEENDFESFAELKKRLKSGHLVIGDDLYVTNPERFQKGLEMKCSHGIIVKPNQVGTLLQSQKVIDMCHKHNQIIVPSHRSGETTDYWLADLAVAWKAQMIKISAAGVDITKHNRLIELWNEIPQSDMAELPFL